MLFVAIVIALVLIGVVGLYTGRADQRARSWTRMACFAVGLAALAIVAMILFLALVARE
jgi:cell division protein FtsW (lipid II flippase)